eukprot:5546874-Alexandrium_andersonii.AAC.1
MRPPVGPLRLSTGGSHGRESTRPSWTTLTLLPLYRAVSAPGPGAGPRSRLPGSWRTRPTRP